MLIYSQSTTINYNLINSLLAKKVFTKALCFISNEYFRIQNKIYFVF